MKVLFKKVIALKCNLQFAICSKIKLSVLFIKFTYILQLH